MTRADKPTTDEMVEKAAIAAYEEMQRPNWCAPQWDEIDAPGQERFLNAARAALKAAAPLIAAKALRDFAKFVMGPSPHMQDAATCRSIALDAEALARRIERGES